MHLEEFAVLMDFCRKSIVSKEVLHCQ